MRSRKLKTSILSILVCCFAGVFCMNYSSGPANSGQRKTGSSFDGSNCSSCHSGGSVTPSVTFRLLSGTTPVTTYTTGGNYTLEVTISPSGNRYGFQCVCVQESSNTDINTWGSLPSFLRNSLSSGRHYIEHNSVLTSGVITIPWTAPSVATGNIVFYASGLIVNNNGSTSGDRCTSNSFTINPCNNPTISSATSHVVCNGGNNGSIDISVTGGSADTFTYSWAGPSGFTATTQDISSLVAGSYTVTVTNQYGCFSRSIIPVNQPAGMAFTPSTNAPICPNATLTLGTSSVIGGTAPYRYLWTGPSGFSDTTANTSISSLSSSRGGTYTLTVTDDNGCTAQRTVTVGFNSVPVVNLGPDQNLCTGLTATLNAANPGSTYVWNTGDTTRTIAVTTDGTYAVRVTNASSCSNTDTVNMHFDTSIVPTINITSSDDSICAGRRINFSSTITNGGTRPTYRWMRNGTFTGLTGATYADSTLASTDFISCEFTSNATCAIPATVYSNRIATYIFPSTTPVVSISRSRDSVCASTPITLTATVSSAGAGPFIGWYIAGRRIDTGRIFNYNPSFGDIVTCRVASTLACPSVDTLDTRYFFPILPFVIPEIVITNTPTDTMRYPGQIVTFFASTTYGGTAPTYKWYMNRRIIAGATSNVYSRRVYERDTIFCVLTSNAQCALPPVDTSNVVTIYKSYVGLSGLQDRNGSIQLVPNPNNGEFDLVGNMSIGSLQTVQWEIKTVTGASVQHGSFASPSGALLEHIKLNQLAVGQYFMTLNTDVEQKVLVLQIK